MSDWISIDDDLPEKYEKVLVISGDWHGDEHDQEEVVDDIFIGVRVEDGVWENSESMRPQFKIFITDYDEVPPDGLVKYWMPLPKPPGDNE